MLAVKCFVYSAAKFPLRNEYGNDCFVILPVVSASMRVLCSCFHCLAARFLSHKHVSLGHVLCVQNCGILFLAVTLQY